MIPPFDENGYLPPGVHRATLTEVIERFGQPSEMRAAQAQSLEWLVDLARRAGLERLIVNGSFTTDVFEPNDVDCALLAGPNSSRDEAIMQELQEGLPFVQFEILFLDDYEHLVNAYYATDRYNTPKGVVEVLL